MPVLESPPVNSFCWIELATTDQNAAKSFYHSLFGWTADDMPMGEAGSYSMLKLGDGGIGGAYTLRPDQRSNGVPPHWALYVRAEDVDASTKRAAELGGKPCMPPFDVSDFGRMAVIGDPTGAMFCLWQPKKPSGTFTWGENGSACWADLSTPDTAAAEKFYSGLFGWKLEKDEDQYIHIKNGNEYIGGISPHHKPEAPPHWMIYFLVADIGKSFARAKELGAKVYLDQTNLEGVGQFAILADPQGAAFALFEAEKK